ncbi:MULTISPECIES: hypothetical protein [Pseudomonas]|uniref:hypothetical protein n=1 Tax=Pseudomonas TaxID=286 RepID=UPI000B06CD83|nr:hypothetical protein [Pseudomonas monteilii]
MLGHESLPAYDGRATVYLDQNILDLAAKQRDPDFFTRLAEAYQVVYSDDTLREIKRSGRPEGFLEVLCSLRAMHFKYALDDSFQPTGRLLICSLSPLQAYQSYLTVEPVYEALLASAHQTTLKMYGGRKESSFEEISAEQVDSFGNLMKHLSDQMVELGDGYQELTEAAAKCIDQLQKQYVIAADVSSREMSKHFNSGEGVSGIQSYREAVGTGPKQLNNIEPPNVIQKIWALYKDLDGYQGMGFSIENFLGISRHPVYGRDMHQHEQVTSIYNVLNVIGYRPDSRLDREQRHVAAISDAAHASIASHCDVLLSGDTAFVSKVRAIYEYLQIPAQIGLITVEDGRIVVDV